MDIALTEKEVVEKRHSTVRAALPAGSQGHLTMFGRDVRTTDYE